MALSFQNKIRTVGAPSAPGTTTPAPTGVSFASKVRPVTTPAPEVKSEGGNAVGNFVKGVISAPATLVARPIQLAAELAGATPEQVNKVNLGGIIAPVPENAGDVKKDVGRAIQTVALGTGAPIAGGAAFGVGSSLEQGNDLFSAQTALQGVVGAAAGKVLDLVGKPLLDATGKVIGTITPKVLKDVASRGADAVAQFAARHEIVPAAAKPAINAIPKVAESIDTGVNKLFSGAGSTLKKAVQSQYPALTGENVAKHYEKVEVDRLFEPTTASGKTFNKATDSYNFAKKQGIDLKKVAADNKVYASEHITDGKFDTKDVADALRSETAGNGPDILRPALTEAAPSVPRVPISDVRNKMISKVLSAPDSAISAEQKKSFIQKIMKEYGDNSVTAASHPNGYDLTNLYDSKLQTSSKIYKPSKGGGLPSISDSLTSQQKLIESQVFDDILRKTAPKELGLDPYFKAQQSRFALADYLQALDGSKAPQTLFQRGVRRAAQLSGATTGSMVAGPFGMFSGYQFGGVVADTFASASNPVKVSFLKSIGKTEPEAYQIMKDYVSKAQFNREWLKTPRLNAPTTIFKGPTQEGIPYTPNPAGFRTTPVVETKKVPLKDIYKKK